MKAERNWCISERDNVYLKMLESSCCNKLKCATNSNDFVAALKYVLISRNRYLQNNYITLSNANIMF